MPYIYILKSRKDGRFYIGSTINLQKRIKDHLSGYVQSTKHRQPLMLFGWRRFRTIEEAVLWEKKYKRSHGQMERDIRSKKIYLT